MLHVEAGMQKKLTITVDEAVYEGLHSVIGPRRISQFIEKLVRPHVLGKHLEGGYRDMAADAEREREAREWEIGTVGDSTDDSR
jgi:hypothetical protein